MPKPFIRLIALLLVPCLIADPAAPAAYQPALNLSLSVVHPFLFNDQAIVGWLGGPAVYRPNARTSRRLFENLRALWRHHPHYGLTRPSVHQGLNHWAHEVVVFNGFGGLGEYKGYPESDDGWGRMRQLLHELVPSERYVVEGVRRALASTSPAAAPSVGGVEPGPQDDPLMGGPGKVRRQSGANERMEAVVVAALAVATGRSLAEVWHTLRSKGEMQHGVFLHELYPRITQWDQWDRQEFLSLLERLKTEQAGSALPGFLENLSQGPQRPAPLIHVSTSEEENLLLRVIKHLQNIQRDQSQMRSEGMFKTPPLSVDQRRYAGAIAQAVIGKLEPMKGPFTEIWNSNLIKALAAHAFFLNLHARRPQRVILRGDLKILHASNQHFEQALTVIVNKMIGCPLELSVWTEERLRENFEFSGSELLEVMERMIEAVYGAAQAQRDSPLSDTGVEGILRRVSSEVTAQLRRAKLHSIEGAKKPPARKRARSVKTSAWLLPVFGTIMLGLAGAVVEAAAPGSYLFGARAAPAGADAGAVPVMRVAEAPMAAQRRPAFLRPFRFATQADIDRLMRGTHKITEEDQPAVVGLFLNLHDWQKGEGQAERGLWESQGTFHKTQFIDNLKVNVLVSKTDPTHHQMEVAYTLNGQSIPIFQSSFQVPQPADAPVPNFGVDPRVGLYLNRDGSRIYLVTQEGLAEITRTSPPDSDAPRFELDIWVRIGAAAPRQGILRSEPMQQTARAVWNFLTWLAGAGIVGVIANAVRPLTRVDVEAALQHLTLSERTRRIIDDFMTGNTIDYIAEKYSIRSEDREAHIQWISRRLASALSQNFGYPVRIDLVLRALTIVSREPQPSKEATRKDTRGAILTYLTSRQGHINVSRMTKEIGRVRRVIYNHFPGNSLEQTIDRLNRERPKSVPRFFKLTPAVVKKMLESWKGDSDEQSIATALGVSVSHLRHVGSAHYRTKEIVRSETAVSFSPTTEPFSWLLPLLLAAGLSFLGVVVEAAPPIAQAAVLQAAPWQFGLDASTLYSLDPILSKSGLTFFFDLFQVLLMGLFLLAVAFGTFYMVFWIIRYELYSDSVRFFKKMRRFAFGIAMGVMISGATVEAHSRPLPIQPHFLRCSA